MSCRNYRIIKGRIFSQSHPPNFRDIHISVPKIPIFPFWSEGNQIPAKCLPEILLGKRKIAKKDIEAMRIFFNSNAGDRGSLRQVQRSHRNCSRSFRVMLSLKSGTGISSRCGFFEIVHLLHSRPPLSQNSHPLCDLDIDFEHIDSPPRQRRQRHCPGYF